MNADAADKTLGRCELDKRSAAVIGAAFRVHTALGRGFLEKVYENALAIEIGVAGLHVRQQVPLTVAYRGIVVGNYVADILVDDAVLVEVKASDGLVQGHRAQCLNYLKASGLRVGLLLNFGTRRLTFERVVNGF